MNTNTIEEKDVAPVATFYPNQQEYDLAMQSVYDFKAPTPEELQAGYAESGKPILEYLQSVYKKPEVELTPEQQQKAKFGAAMSDSLASLAEMYAHGRGATIREREPNMSQKTTNARLKEIQDKYDKDLLHYNSVMSGGQLQDWRDYLSAAMSESGQKRENLLYRAKTEQGRRDTWEKREYEKEKAANKSAADEKKEKRRFSNNLKIEQIRTANRRSNNNDKVTIIPYGAGKSIIVPRDKATNDYIQDAMYRQLISQKNVTPPKGKIKYNGMIPVGEEPLTPNDIRVFIDANSHLLPDDFYETLGANVFGAYNPDVKRSAAPSLGAKKELGINWGK